MGIKLLGFEGIKKKAEEFREIAKVYRFNEQFDIDSHNSEKFLMNNPLAPIIGTICDQWIRAEDAWNFPYWLSKEINKGNFTAQVIYDIGKKEMKNLLQSFMNDKWPSGMAEKDRKKYLENTSSRIVDACSIIIQQYDNNPDNTFKEGKYSAPEIYFILRILPGIGPKKASMIARDFVKGEGQWYEGIYERLKRQGIEFIVKGQHLSEVPVDVHVVKVFGRVMGEFKNTPQRKKFLDYWPDIQNFAKLAFPDFPGKIDEILWTVGRSYCDEKQPNCKDCPLKKIPCEYATRWG